MSKDNLGECVKLGLGLELVRESAFTLLELQRRPDLVDMFYDFQKSLNAVYGFSILTAPYFYAYQIPDEISSIGFGVVGSLLVTSAVYHLVRNRRSNDF